MPNNETTTKFKVDISELKKEFQEAQRVIRVANSEFKAATAGMDNWSESADGLQKKIDQLSDVLGAEKTKLASLEKQYELTAKEQGETSKGAQDLLVKLNNQKAAVANVEKQLKKWQTALDDVGQESDDLVTTIGRQETELKHLKDEYVKIIAQQGKTSGEAKELETAIRNLSGELLKNKSALDDARKEADKLDGSFDDASDSADKAADGGITTFKIALGNLLADGISAVISGLVDMTKELANVDGAYNNFQVQTGKTAAEMEEFSTQIDELYKNNLGESLDDVADAMAKVAQNTKETDPTAIKELTENALVLRDSFGYDIQESMRAVNMLMDQFGISGDEAFNLIVQGAQNGLDKNGDMLDSINEYAVHYEKLGYDADDFFNSLANGTDAGTFSVDKLGDAMKEFGIRVIDTAESTTEGFELVGLNADEMRQMFAEGGIAAQKASKKTMEALLNTDDKVKQNQAGVALFGTMWEDLGVEGVAALMSVEGELTSTKESMQEIKDIKYDDVMNELGALGREFQTEIMLPIVKKALPKIREAIKWVSENLDTLVPIVGSVGAAFLAMLVVSKVASFVQSIVSLVKVVKTMTTATKAQTAAQTALNATNPFGWVALAITAVTALVGVLVGLSGSNKNMVEEYSKLTAEEQKLRDETNKLTEAYRDWKDAKDDAFSNTAAEFDYYSELSGELQTIVDENGKIKKGYEDRAAVITGILSEALGTEITITDGVIQKYGELKQSIDDVIIAKKAEAMLSSMESSYTEAIQNKNTALQNYTENQKAFNELLKEQNAVEADYWNLVDGGIVAYAEANGMKVDATSTQFAYNAALKDSRAKLDGVNAKLADQKAAYYDSEEAYLGYLGIIKQYEGVSAAVISGDTDKINESLLLLEHGFLDATTGTQAALESQTAGYKKELENLKKAIKDKTPGVTQEQVDQMENLVEKSEAELAKLAPKAETQGEKAVDEFSDGIDSATPKAEAAAEDVSDSAADALKSADSETSGENFAEGFADGISSKSNSIWDTATTMAKNALEAVQSALDSHSPSRKTMKLGEFFDDGLLIGIEDGENSLLKTVKNLANTIVQTLKEELNFDYDLFGQLSADIAKINSTDFGVTTNVSGVNNTGNDRSTTQTVNNFYQTNNSPKELDRIEIYRQTKNLLSTRG